MPGGIPKRLDTLRAETFVSAQPDVSTFQGGCLEAIGSLGRECLTTTEIIPEIDFRKAERAFD